MGRSLIPSPPCHRCRIVSISLSTPGTAGTPTPRRAAGPRPPPPPTRTSWPHNYWIRLAPCRIRGPSGSAAVDRSPRWRAASDGTDGHGRPNPSEEGERGPAAALSCGPHGLLAACSGGVAAGGGVGGGRRLGFPSCPRTADFGGRRRRACVFFYLMRACVSGRAEERGNGERKEAPGGFEP